MGIKEILEAYNGSIHLEPGRYGGGWICVVIKDDFYESDILDLFSDLVCCDNDYFNARDILQNRQDCVFIEHAKSLDDAIKRAFQELGCGKEEP